MLFRQTFFIFIIIFNSFLFGENNLPHLLQKNRKDFWYELCGCNDLRYYRGSYRIPADFVTGHLIIASEFLAEDSSSKIRKEALNAYLIVIQGGAILAVD